MALGGILLVAACTDDKATPLPDQRKVAGVRVIDPPAGDVRAAPPFAIVSNGIGPANIGMDFATVFGEIQMRPHIVFVRLDEVVNQVLSRGANRKLVVGGDSAERVRYLAALDESMGRTEEGLRVGIPSQKAQELMGESPEYEGVHAKEIMRFAKTPAITAIVSGGNVVAITIAAPLPSSLCFRGQESCSSPQQKVSVNNSTLELVSPSGRIIGRAEARGLQAASLVDLNKDQKPDVAAIVDVSSDDKIHYVLRTYQLSGQRLVAKDDMELFVATHADMRLAGLSPTSTDLLVELYRTRDGELYIGGFLWSADDLLIAPLVSRQVPFLATNKAR